jgi:hypothetical protein
MEPQRQQPQQHAMLACYGLAILASGEASLCDHQTEGARAGGPRREIRQDLLLINMIYYILDIEDQFSPSIATAMQGENLGVPALEPPQTN